MTSRKMTTRRKLLVLGALGTVLFISAFVTQAYAFVNGQPADLSIGGIRPTNFAFDSSGNLWVGTFDSEVLEFRPPFGSSSGPAFILAGSFQISIVAFDNSGNLWVATAGQGRILEFKPPFSGDANPSLVIGQSDFQTIYSGPPPPPSDHTLDPVALTFDSSGNLWAVDGGGGVGNRILEFKQPFSNGMSASLVLGQPTFQSNVAVLSQSGLGCAPLCALTFDQSGALWVVSQAQNRVLRYTPPFASGMNASLVIGQTNFYSGAASRGMNGFSQPFGVALDSGGNLWVGDTLNNHRVLEFRTPFTTRMNASLALGQPTFGSSDNGGNLAFDLQGNLWAGDPAHLSVVEFQSSVTVVITSTSSTSSSSIAIVSSTSSTSSSSSVSSSSTTTTITPTTSTSLRSANTSTTFTSTASSPTTTATGSISAGGSSLTTSSGSASSSASNGGGGIPEFPYQLVGAVVFTALIITSYLLARRRQVRNPPV